MSKRARTWLRRCMLAIVLGAMMTVGVAWGLAYTKLEIAPRDHHIFEHRQHDGAMIDVAARSSIGHLRRSGVVEHIGGIPLPLTINEYGTKPAPTSTKTWDTIWHGDEPWGHIRRDRMWTDSESWNAQVEEAFGWPRLTFWHALTRDPQDSFFRNVLPANSLPTTPIWSGFAINTLFYALLFLGLAALSDKIKAMRRGKQGCCPHCGYDLSGLTSSQCPECGTIFGASR